jgi:hypothetical protein
VNRSRVKTNTNANESENESENENENEARALLDPVLYGNVFVNLKSRDRGDK